MGASTKLAAVCLESYSDDTHVAYFKRLNCHLKTWNAALEDIEELLATVAKLDEEMSEPEFCAESSWPMILEKRGVRLAHACFFICQLALRLATLAAVLLDDTLQVPVCLCMSILSSSSVF